MSRTSNIKVMNDNLDIFSKGHYFIGNKRINVDIPSIEGNTTLIGLNYKPVRVYQHNPTTIEITNETTISLILRLIGDNVKDIGVLNFASGKKQGGGCLKGSMAQEESLMYTTCLYESIKGCTELYDYNKTADCFYSDYMIYSKNIKVIRNEYHVLLPDPPSCSFITSPAVNVRGMSLGNKSNRVIKVMTDRIDKILNVFHKNGNTTIVLGAFGCGVFENDPITVAQIFNTLLTSKYKNVFKRVVFAIYDTKGSIISDFRNNIQVT